MNKKTAALDAGSATGTVPIGRAGVQGILVAMCTCLVLVVASVSALNLAMPDLAVDLSASTTSLTWIADSYTVALAALVLPIGALGDKFGRRDILIGGTLVFAIGSAAASFADSTTTLIAWRVVMGVGAAMIMPGTLSTITSAFPAAQRDRGVAMWSGFAAAGAIIGLLAAGALLETWSWRSIFVVSAVVSVLCASTEYLRRRMAASAEAEAGCAAGLSGSSATARSMPQFDRLISSQAFCERLQLLTADRVLLGLGRDFITDSTQ